MYGQFKQFLLGLTTAASLAGAPLVAYAEPPPDPPTDATEGDLERAKELFENGKGLYAEGSYSAAIAAFRQAYTLSGDPVLLYNIALAHDRAGEFDAALEYLGYYRAYAPQSERAALSEKEDSLRKRKLRAQTDEEEAAAEAAEQGTDEEAEGPPPPKASLSDDGPPDDTSKPRQKVFTVPVWVLTGVSVVGLGVGTGLGVTALARRDDADALCTANGMGGTVCPQAAESDADTGRKMALGADVAFGIGAAAGVVAVILIARNASRRKKTQTATLVPRSRGAGIQLRF
ncbi:MAG: hypothetical protein KUG77_05840 [Nannocystaceae bacterium]|nr:hypothetical protein [Nannocystaceae bacterium]